MVSGEVCMVDVSYHYFVYDNKGGIIHCQHVVQEIHLAGAMNCSKMFGTYENA